MENSNILRTLAKSYHWQIIYSRSKELNGIKIFNNENDFSAIQISFLQWLEIYYSLEMDLAMKEENISREVIDDEIRCDAYLYWKDISRNNKDKETSKFTPDQVSAVSDVPSIVFKRG